MLQHYGIEVLLCPDDQEAIVLYTDYIYKNIYLEVNKCGILDKSKIDCAPQDVLDDLNLIDSKFKLTWFYPTKSYQPSEYGENMVTGSMAQMDFEFD